ncbi:MAG: UTP--glucose-1-phosphate uridylyltransferase [Candidatus Micrarchaeaceae archaeon]
MAQKVRKAVIPAAGLGTRFYPLTRAQPKEMLPIVDKPVIHYVVEEALSAGIDEILIITGYGKDTIIDYFDYNSLDEKFQNDEIKNFPDIYFVRQKKQLGLGDALKYAKGFTEDKPFLVLLGDTIYESKTEKSASKQLIEKYEMINKPLMIVESVPENKIKDYGIIGYTYEKDGFYKIESVIEKPEIKDAPSDLGITGLYIFESDIYNYLEKIRTGKNNEYQLADALNLFVKEKELFGTKIDAVRYDIGTKELWFETFVEFLKKDKRFAKIFK